MEESGVNEEKEGQLTPSSGSGGAGTGDEGAAGGAKHSAKSKQQDESDEEDWGLEGKSFWKSRIPQSVDTASYVQEQLPSPIEEGYMVWQIL